MKRIFWTFILTAAVMLAGCSDSEGLSSDRQTESITSQTNTSEMPTQTTSTISAETSSEAADSNRQIRVKIISYADETLTYEYEGKELTVPLPVKVLDDTPYGIGQTLAEKVIDNRFGGEIYADLLLSIDGSSVIYCDVFTPNGIVSYSNNDMPEDDASHTLQETEVTVKRIEGSIFEFTGSFGSIRGDINDMNSEYKGNIPDYAERVAFRGIRFGNGELMLTTVMVYDHDDDSPGGPVPEYRAYDCKDMYRFFGRIESLDEDRAMVMLNDGKTTCDVPTYYNDGELTVGQEVLLILDAEPSLFGSGQQYKADYAVFLTQPGMYIESYDELDHSRIAYVHMKENNTMQMICTMTDEQEQTK